jgi:Cu/Ag efflux protein CusF
LDYTWRGRGIMKSVVFTFVLSFVGFVANSFAQNVFTYQVTGTVRAMPGNGRAVNELLVKHDPIPQYRDRGGNIVGMKAMTMPFYIAEGVKLDGIHVGDAVEMKVQQQLQPTFSERVIEIHTVEQ